MNIFTDLLFLFIFIYSMLFFKIPDIETDNYIYHKLIFFVTIFLFTFISQILMKLRNNCKIIASEIFNRSLEVAISGLIGYSLYIDLTIMESTKEYMTSYSKYILYLMIALTIVLFIGIVKIARVVFSYNENDCVKNTYDNNPKEPN